MNGREARTPLRLIMSDVAYWAQDGHPDRRAKCQLFEQERTSRRYADTSSARHHRLHPVDHELHRKCGEQHAEQA